LWDSWEDDAEIRDVATGRFVDRDKLHYIDFTGRWFAVKGPSITPRPPQGQPIVAALGHRAEPYQLISSSADVGFVTPKDKQHAQEIVGQINGAHVFADLVVSLGDRGESEPFTSDATVFAGTATELADLLLDWQQAGLTGFRLRPARIPYDLERITPDLVPELRRRGGFRPEHGSTAVRGLLGLPRPANRYATAAGE